MFTASPRLGDHDLDVGLFLPRFHHVLARLRYVWTGDVQSPDRLFLLLRGHSMSLLPFHFIVTYDI